MLRVVKTPPGEAVHPGDVLDGRYKLLRVIGEGGMGTVFLAEHVLIKRRVAIKILHSDLARDAEVVERFMNEARAAGTLGHPNIVESTDMGFARHEVPFIVFEYLEGTMLSDEVYRLGGLPVRRALKIAHQIASALDAAHRAGIIHRDLKADNVFLTDKDDHLDHVKVLDFGISRFLEAGKDDTSGGKRRGVTMGTPEFMAPEQITNPETVDGRTDIYALGVVLYEMLAARTPFLNENKSDPAELLHRIVLDKPPPLTRAGLPAGLADMILDKLLAKDPTDRYQSMRDVQAALEAFTSVLRRDTQPIPKVSVDDGEQPADAQAPAVQPAPPQPAAKRRPLWPLAVLALAAGAAGVALLLAPPKQIVAAKDTTALDRGAAQLASALDAAANSARLRAEGLATSPMLRAAIETDAATLADMVRDGFVFKPQPGEVLEIFQLRDGKTTSLLRIPSSAPPITPTDKPRVAAGASADKKALEVLVGVQVTKTAGDVGGSLALAVPVDLSALAASAGEHALDAKLTGPGVNVVLAARHGSAGTGTTAVKTVEHSIRIGTKLAELSLVATVAPTITMQRYTLPAYGCLAAAGLFVLLYIIGLISRR